MQLESLVAMSAFAFAPGDADAACRPLDVAWLSDTAAAVIVKQEYPGGHATRHAFVCSAGGHAAEVLLDDDEPCQLAAEIDGCVVLGEHSWTLVRDVPMAVQRVRPPSLTTHPCTLGMPRHRNRRACILRVPAALAVVSDPVARRRTSRGPNKAGAAPCAVAVTAVSSRPVQYASLAPATGSMHVAPTASACAPALRAWCGHVRLSCLLCWHACPRRGRTLKPNPQHLSQALRVAAALLPSLWCY